MKIAFIVYHPVETHFYSTIAKNLKEKHEVYFIIIEKEGIESQLLNYYNFPYFLKRRLKGGLFLNILNVPFILWFILKTFIKSRPDLIVSAASPYIGLISKLLLIKSIGWTDTETASFNNNLAFPFFSTLLIPSCFYKKVDIKKVIHFNSYKEIGYLHPKYFKPDISILNKVGLNKEDRIILMRFSALHAVHDIGLASEIEKNEKRILNFIKEINKFAKVFISCTEKNLSSDFKPYILHLQPIEYLHFLSFCSLYIGEGTTTASEAGVLGIPWIALRSIPLGYLEDQETNFGLGIRTSNLDLAFSKAIEWLNDTHTKEKWQNKREILLKSKIDISAFMIWFIENFPESLKICKANPEFQNEFM